MSTRWFSSPSTTRRSIQTARREYQPLDLPYIVRPKASSKGLYFAALCNGSSQSSVWAHLLFDDITEGQHSHTAAPSNRNPRNSGPGRAAPSLPGRKSII